MVQFLNITYMKYMYVYACVYIESLYFILFISLLYLCTWFMGADDTRFLHMYV